ncbi:MAG: STAS domain-containing protein [Chitinispirillaceae bacterium]|nr:STAS domain-containing protein [Chitinispirillaceae bacterium]
MKLKASTIKGYPSLEISGQIIGDYAAQVKSKIDTISRKHKGNLVINLSEVTFIDSYGLGVLVYIWKLYRSNSRDIIFLCSGNFDLDIFSAANLDSLFTIIRSEGEL